MLVEPEPNPDRAPARFGGNTLAADAALYELAVDGPGRSARAQQKARDGGEEGAAGRIVCAV
jgi:hypothetical protein